MAKVYSPPRKQRAKKPQQPMVSQKPALCSRGGSLSAAERTTFNSFFDVFWTSYEAAPREVTTAELLAIEEAAFLEIGTERDVTPAQRNNARRQIINLLGEEDAGLYLDFLLTLTRANINHDSDFETARGILQQILMLFPEDCYFQNEMGRALEGLGRIEQALTHFERALANLPADEIVSEVYSIQLAVARTRALAEAPQLTAERLGGLLELLFSPPAEMGRRIDFLVQEKTRLCQLLMRRNISLAVLVAVFGRAIPGELTLAYYDSLGELSETLDLLFRAEVKKEQPASVAEVCRAAEMIERGFGQRAAGLYVNYRVDNLVAADNLSGAKRLIRTAVSEGEIMSATAAEIEEGLQGLETDQRAEQIFTRLQAALAVQVFKPIPLVKDLLSVLFYHSDGKREIRNFVWVKLSDLATKNFADPVQQGKLVRIFRELWQREPATRSYIRAFFKGYLSDQDRLAQVAKVLREARTKSIDELETEANAKTKIKKKKVGKAARSAKKTVALIAPPEKEPIFQAICNIFDFVFLTLGDLEVVASLCRAVDTYYAQGVNFKSTWYQVLAGKAEEAEQKTAYMQQALKEDPNNLVAEVYLLERELEAEAQAGGTALLSELEGAIVLPEDKLDPFLRLKFVSLLVQQYFRLINVYIAEADSHSVAEIRSYARSLAQKAREVYSRDADAIADLFDINFDDWHGVFNGLGALHAVATDFVRAAEYYGEITNQIPGKAGAADQGAYALRCLGRYLDGANTLTTAINATKGTRAILFINLGDLLFEAGQPEKAARYAQEGLTKYSEQQSLRPVPILLTLAEIFAHNQRFERAERLLAEVEAQVTTGLRLAKKEKDPASRHQEEKKWQSYSASAALCRGRVLYYEGETELSKLRELYQQMIDYAKKDHSLVYEEIKARWSLGQAVATEAEKIRVVGQPIAGQPAEQLLVEAVKVFNELLASFPLFPAAHQYLIGTLITLNREVEALEHARFFIDNIHGLDPDVLANLTILTMDSRGEINTEAEKIIFVLRDSLSQSWEEAIVLKYFELAAVIVRANYPDWEPTGRLAELFQFEEA